MSHQLLNQLLKAAAPSAVYTAAPTAIQKAVYTAAQSAVKAAAPSAVYTMCPQIAAPLPNHSAAQLVAKVVQRQMTKQLFKRQLFKQLFKRQLIRQLLKQLRQLLMFSLRKQKTSWLGRPTVLTSKHHNTIFKILEDFVSKRTNGSKILLFNPNIW